MESNDFNKTQYDQNTTAYIDSNVGGGIGGKTPLDRVEFIKNYLPVGSSIFEIGSGDGTDAKALINAGYKITASDFSKSFLDVLDSKNIPYQHFDILKDTPPLGCRLIYANAVLVHISPDNMKSFFKRCKESMDSSTVIFATFLKGKGSERSARGRGFERDFYYYEESDLKTLLESLDIQIKYLESIDSKWIWLVTSL